MNWKFSFVNPVLNENKNYTMNLTQVDDIVKLMNSHGYELVNMMTYGTSQILPSLLLVFWRTAAGPCPLMLPMTAARKIELDVS